MDSYVNREKTSEQCPPGRPVQCAASTIPRLRYAGRPADEDGRERESDSQVEAEPRPLAGAAAEGEVGCRPCAPPGQNTGK